MRAPDRSTALGVLTLLNPRLKYHRASIQGLERIPGAGGALIVSNHGRLDFDSFLLLRLLLRSRDNPVRMLADHMWFRLPLTRRLFALAGAVDGTRDTAIQLLDRGEVVLTYPGGVREIMGSTFRREHIAWEGRTGFAHVAIQARVPVIPIVGVGVNSGLIFLSSGRLLGALLFRWLLRLGPAYADYRNPLALGVLPLPLPLSTAVALPLPCKLTYVVGEPILPPEAEPGESATQLEARFARQIADSMRELIARHGHPA